MNNKVNSLKSRDILLWHYKRLEHCVGDNTYAHNLNLKKKILVWITSESSVAMTSHSLVAPATPEKAYVCCILKLCSDLSNLDYILV